MQNGTASQYTNITIDPDQVSGSLLLNVMVHELGHNYGEGDCTACSNTVMSYPVTGGTPIFPTGCDVNGIYDDTGETEGENNACITAPPSCSGGAAASCSSGGVWACSDNGSCPGVPPSSPDGPPICTPGAGWKCNPSPIVIDPFDEGFSLTDVSNGVPFTMTPGTGLHQMSWIRGSSRNGWLALDRNNNGKIDDLTELFGDLTPQPPSNDRNGYRALEVFDTPEQGGNANGWIDPGDAIYSHLKIWIDGNHNGISEPNELHSLSELGVFRISLHYWRSEYVDQNGNKFRFKSRVLERSSKEHACYDVFLTVDMQ